MSLVTELFGMDVLNKSLDELKELIKAMPPAQRERRSYLLKDFARIKNIELTQQDFADVNA